MYIVISVIYLLNKRQTHFMMIWQDVGKTWLPIQFESFSELSTGKLFRVSIHRTTERTIRE